VYIKGDKGGFISCTKIIGGGPQKNENKEEHGAGVQMRDARARHPRLIRPFCEKSVHKEARYGHQKKYLGNLSLAASSLRIARFVDRNLDYPGD